MLTENDVVNILVADLKNKNYKIVQSLTTTDKGFDIIAEKNGTTLYVEAKGGTSSKATSRRHGKPFSKNQIGTHLAVAILTVIRILAKKDKKLNKVAIAFPDNEDHRNSILPIAPVLKKLGILIFLVKENIVTEL